MKVGLFFLNHFKEGVDPTVVLKNLIEQVHVARDSGFDSLWTGEHRLVGPMQFIAPSQLLPRLIPEAGDMTIGPNVTVLPLRHPADVAEEVVTMDLLTGGRYVLCVSLGYREEEFQSLGIPFKERASRLTEGVELLRKLMTQDMVTHHGKHYSVEGLGIGLRPLQTPHPPIWVEAHVDAAVRRAARIGDTWVPPFQAPFELLERQLPMYRAELEASDKPFPSELPLTREVHIGATRAEALEEARGPLGYKYGAYEGWGLKDTDDGSIFDRLMEECFFVGDPESVKDQFLRYREELGFNHMICRVQWPGMEQEKALNTIRQLGKIVSEIN